jgi:outer membrane protein TolC
LFGISSLCSGQTLVEAIEQTLLTNPNIQSSAYNVDAADALRRQAVAGYLPSIDLVLARGLEKSDKTRQLEPRAMRIEISIVLSAPSH